MLRSNGKGARMLSHATFRFTNVITSRPTLSLLSSHVNPVRLQYSGSTDPSLRTFHCMKRPSIIPCQPFNFPPIGATFQTKITPNRVGIRFINSDSKNTAGKEDPKDTSISTPESSSISTPSTVGTPEQSKLSATSENQSPALHEIVNSVDTTIQRVRGKVSPKDLLYYFALLATFGILVVSPLVARHMQRSDTDYDELDSEDPIADLATFVRTEFLKESVQGVDHGTGSSTMGGLDTILADLLRSPQIQNAINDLVNKILTSPQFKRSCSILLKELWKDLVEDPETLKQVIHLLYNAIQDEAIKDAAVQLVTEVFADKEVLDEVVELFQRLGKEPKVQMATQELLVESAHNALNDPEILDHSMEFATDVVGDDVVQQTAGEALYNTLSYAVRPTLSVFLAILGTGLIFVSLMAFQHSISPESQSESLDKALTSFEKSSLIQGVIKLVTFPWHALVACKDVLTWMLMLPIRAVSGTLAGLGRAGNATVDVVNRYIHWLLNLPVHLAQSLLGVLGHGLTTISDGLARQSRQLARALSGSFFGVLFHHVADGFLATSRGLHLAWVASNDIAASGALAVEAFGNRTIQFGGKVITKTIVLWSATKSKLVTGSHAARDGWTSANHAVATGALLVEGGIKTSWVATIKLAKRIKMFAMEMWLTKDSIQSVTTKSRQILITGYKRSDQAAERIGKFLEDLLDKLVITIRGKRGHLGSL